MNRPAGHEEAAAAMSGLCGDALVGLELAYPIIEKAVRRRIVEALRKSADAATHTTLIYGEGFRAAANFIERELP